MTAVRIFSVSPTQPMTRIRFGFSIVLVSRNLSADWKKMLMPRAIKKTPLKKAPTTGARSHPKVYGPLLDLS
jgi:hypothetical protein